MVEIWKVYKETYNRRFGNRKYEVSNLGNVKINKQLVKPKLHNGYLVFGTNYSVHRAVAELFIPNTEDKPFIDHINTIKTDNRAENLRWVTAKENMNNPLTIEKMKLVNKDINKGVNHPMYGKNQSKKTIEKRRQKLLGHKNWVPKETYNNPIFKENAYKLGKSNIGKHRVYDNPEHTKWHMEL